MLPLTCDGFAQAFASGMTTMPFSSRENLKWQLLVFAAWASLRMRHSVAVVVVVV